MYCALTQQGPPPAGDGSINDEDLDSDVKVALTENEMEIRSYLIHNEPLSEETIEKFANIFWNSEPYRYIHLSWSQVYMYITRCCLLVPCALRSTGFIMEGFPQSPDELRYLCSKGFYPDVAVIFQVSKSCCQSPLYHRKLLVTYHTCNMCF